MLYYFALSRGLADLPEANRSLRTFLSAQAEKKSWPWLHHKLSHYDPDTAAHLSPNDGQRIQRAWEIMILTGKKMSELRQRSSTKIACKPIALIPPIREDLYQRIAQRFDQMLEQGFISEVEHLRNQYPSLHPEMPAMRCPGYRQIWQFLSKEIDQMSMREQAIIATRKLAKRQLTWLRSLPECQIVKNAEEACSLLLIEISQVGSTK